MNWLQKILDFLFGSNTPPPLAKADPPPITTIPPVATKPVPPVAISPATKPASPAKSRLQIAMEITSGFEGEGFTEISDDDDGQGVSAGALQWCLGQGSLQGEILQPFILKYGSIDKLGIFPMSIDGVASMSPSRALSFCRTNMLVGSQLKPVWLKAWKTLMGRADMIDIQLTAAAGLGKKAEQLIASLGLTSLRAYCWAFDIVVENGGMKGVGLAKGDRFVASDTIGKMPTDREMGGDDTSRNKPIWQALVDKVSEEQLSLLITTDARSRLSKTEFYCDVVNRKAAIAFGDGYVHETRFRFPQLADDSHVEASTASDRETLIRLATSVSIPAEQVNRVADFRDRKYPQSRPRYWGFVNFGVHSSKKRLYIFDVVENSVRQYLVAHGKGSEGPTDDGMADVFSNENGSNCSSLGIYRAAEPYDGKHGLSLALDGLETSNSHVRDRSIVLHGADYVSPETVAESGRCGRSEGCFAVENRFAPELVSELSNGSFIIAWKA